MASRRNAAPSMTVAQAEQRADQVIDQMRAANLQEVKVVANPPMRTDDGSLVESSKIEVKTVDGGEVERTTVDKLKPADSVMMDGGMVVTSNGTALVTTVAPGVPGAQTGNWQVMSSFLFYAIAIFILWVVGVWDGSLANYDRYTRYPWATAAVMGIFTTFALFLLFVATAWASYLTRTNSTCYQLTVVDYVLYIFQLLFYVIAAIVIFRTESGTGTTRTSTNGANACFWLTLVGGILGLVQAIIVCVTISRCGCSWLPLIPMVLYLAWVVVALVVFYKMWRN